MCSVFCFCEGYGNHRDLHVLTHSFPTRRSSDLVRLGKLLCYVGPMRPFRRIDHEQGQLGVRPHRCRPGERMPEITQDYLAARRSGRLCSALRSEEHTSELQSLMRISYAVFCLKKKKKTQINH